MPQKRTPLRLLRGLRFSGFRWPGARRACAQRLGAVFRVRIGGAAAGRLRFDGYMDSSAQCLSTGTALLKNASADSHQPPAALTPRERVCRRSRAAQGLHADRPSRELQPAAHRHAVAARGVRGRPNERLKSPILILFSALLKSPGTPHQ